MVNGELGLDTYKILGRDLDQDNSTAYMFVGDNRGGRGLVKHANTKKKKKYRLSCISTYITDTIY